MHRSRLRIFIFMFAAFCLSWLGLSGFAQTGGGIDLSHNVIAGGGQRSTGGGLTLEGTVGQANAGDISTGGALTLRSGFWEFGILVPTAAGVTLSGRVISSSGRPIRGVRVSLNSASGTIRYVLTSSFGFYRFDDVPAGDTYLVGVRHKTYQFGEPVRVVIANDNLSDIIFTALPN